MTLAARSNTTGVVRRHGSRPCSSGAVGGRSPAPRDTRPWHFRAPAHTPAPPASSNVPAVAPPICARSTGWVNGPCFSGTSETVKIDQNTDSHDDNLGQRRPFAEPRTLLQVQIRQPRALSEDVVERFPKDRALLLLELAEKVGVLENLLVFLRDLRSKEDLG